MELDTLYTALDRCLQPAARAGIRCAPGCGQCCERPSRQIEASVTEMVPLARALWTEGAAERVLDRAEEAGAEGWCVLYEREPGEGPYSRGRCLHYGFRPLTCRLFGYSVVTDGRGRTIPWASPVMKTRMPDLGARFEAVDSIPTASDWRARMAEVSPEAAFDLLPLNEALAQALRREGLVRRLSEDEGSTPLR